MYAQLMFATRKYAAPGAMTLALMLTVAVAASPASGQQAGTITGQVLAAQTQQPVASVQVFIANLNIGTLSQSNGRYLLQNVPPGTHTLTAERIGYRTMTQDVQVAAGGTVVINLQVSTEALALNEIIVTGTPGGTQRRAIGNAVGRVDMSTAVQDAGATSLQSVLGSRVAGLSLNAGSGGAPGTGGVIRVRGLSSFSLTNEPIVYIDGIRMDNNSNAGVGGGQMNRINDIDPSSIESIEVIKGPAAATLYGTEASSGVIQIITKRGVPGAPVIDVSMQVGANWLQRPAERAGITYWRNPTGGELLSFNLYEFEKETGLVGDAFSTGLLQSYDASVRGGTEAIRYYGFLGFDNSVGIEPQSYHKRKSARLNLDMTLHETLDAELGLGVVRNAQRLVGTTVYGTFHGLRWGRPDRIGVSRGWYRAPPEHTRRLEFTDKVDRFTGSLRLSHTPTEWLTQRLVVGADVGSAIDDELWPKVALGQQTYYGGRDNGRRDTEIDDVQLLTLDYGATVDYDLSPSINTQTSVGLQYYKNETHFRRLIGDVFPVPSVTTIGGTAVTSASENFVENATAGAYIQEQFGWNNRIFVTAAVRADDNSAFGTNFDAAVYPKFSAAWVISEEPFWNVGVIDELRIRSAWGASGMQPDVFAARRLYDPRPAIGSVSAISPGAVGNPDLKPERGEELELGFDVSLLDGRLSAELTHYRRTTTDAILRRAIAPSEGFPGIQFINAGEVRSWGTELALNANLVQGSSFRWDVGFTGSQMGNRIEDLGEAPPFSVPGRHWNTLSNRHTEGFSLGAFHHVQVVSAELEPVTNAVINVMCVAGPDALDQVLPCAEAERIYWSEANPTWEVGFQTSVTIGQNLRLSARIDAKGGHRKTNVDLMATQTGFFNTFHSNNLDQFPIYQAYRSVVGREPTGLYRADFAKLREVSATYTLPQSWTSDFGMSRASISVSGRNLATLWAPGKFVQLPNMDGQLRGPGNPEGGPDRIWDPEMDNSHVVLSAHNVGIIPPVASVVSTIRLTF